MANLKKNYGPQKNSQSLIKRTYKIYSFYAVLQCVCNNRKLSIFRRRTGTGFLLRKTQLEIFYLEIFHLDMIKMVESLTRVFTNQLKSFQLKPLQLNLFPTGIPFSFNFICQNQNIYFVLLSWKNDFLVREKLLFDLWPIKILLLKLGIYQTRDPRTAQSQDWTVLVR